MERDVDLFRSVREYAQRLKSEYAGRNELLQAMEDMYLLEWEDQGQVERTLPHAKVTISPDPRVKCQGVVRLMSASEPVFHVGREVNQRKVDPVGDRMEKMARILWRAGGRIQGNPLHYDAVKSAVVYGWLFIGVDATEDMVQAAEGGSAAALARVKETARQTPYLFEVYNPMGCYPDYDRIGMRAWYREYEALAADVVEQYGEDGEAALGKRRGVKTKDKGLYAPVWLCEFYDLEWRVVWLRDAGENGLLVMVQHGLPFIPRVGGPVEGSRLFEEPEDQSEPFLYTLYKSGLWKRQNLALTAMSTNVFGMGLNPILIQQMGPDGQKVTPDYSVPGGIWRVPQGSSLQAMTNRGIVDPAVMQLMQIAESKSSEATIHGQALGAPAQSGGVAFSTIALLSQAGRLPLVPIQRKTSWYIGDAVKIALTWLREGGKGRKASYGKETADLKASDIPREGFEIECTLDIALPQDRLQMTTIASNAVQGGLASRRWARENVMQIEDSDQMDKELWAETMAQAVFQALMQGKVQELVMGQQQGQPPMQPPTQPPTLPPEGMEGMGPMEEMGGGGPVYPEGRAPGPEMMGEEEVT